MYEDDEFYAPNVEDHTLFADRRSDSVASEYARAMRRNNPSNEPVGNYTGRCRYCGSQSLWEDNLAYGCNTCGAFLGGN